MASYFLGHNMYVYYTKPPVDPAENEKNAQKT